LAKRNELRSTGLHSIRHYSATELLAAGIDLRSVAGRLGHGIGGATTLKFYATWVERPTPQPPRLLLSPSPVPTSASASRGMRSKSSRQRSELPIDSGRYPVGSELPYARDLATAHNVSVGTVSRAIADLRERGLVEARQYQRARVIRTSGTAA
jgi:DNA-binding transcriptional ArsR family regulator